MKIDVTSSLSVPTGMDLVVVAVRNEGLSDLLKGSSKKSAKSVLGALNRESNDLIRMSARSEKWRAVIGTTLSCSYLLRGRLRTFVLFGLGEKKGDAAAEIKILRRLGAAVTEHARRVSARRVWVAGLQREDECAIRAWVQAVELSSYRFLKYKSSQDKSSKPPTSSLSITLQLGDIAPSQARKFIEEAQEFSRATAMARDMVNTPARDCTPRDLVRRAREIARKGRLRVQIFDRARLQSMGAHALLAVAQGSEEPPFLIKLVYRPRGRAKKIVALVGKGVTFDSGGLSIKTGAGMETMKIDMSGAAAVLAAMQVIARQGCPHEVRAYIPTVENMINGRATRPGDIVKGMAGKSIEILNTDAEGRLILSDALTLAEREGADQIVDVATLTGACMVALGSDYAGLFSSDEKLAQKLLDAAEIEGEPLWRMPLPPEYRDLIKSPTADIKNTGGPYGGAITAALFLKEFVEKTPWAHLDIAGPAHSDSDKGLVRRGGTGFAARTLARYVLEL